jgi:hypothetical protein
MLGRGGSDGFGLLRLGASSTQTDLWSAWTLTSLGDHSSFSGSR